MTPGSPAALAAGCKCPRLHNAPASGYYPGPQPGDGPRWFVVSEACRLHWHQEPDQLSLFKE